LAERKEMGTITGVKPNAKKKNKGKVFVPGGRTRGGQKGEYGKAWWGQMQKTLETG